MSLSSQITGMILEMLGNGGTVEIQRNELAQTVGCVPSQINYVIASRFTRSRAISSKPQVRRRL